MRAFVDSSALIAFHRKEDQHFEEAGRIFDALREKNASLYLSNHVLEEVVTFLAARQGAETAYQIGIRLMQSPQVTVLFSTEKNVLAALDVLKKHDGLSLCDALTSVLMNENGIEPLASFDSDFDQFNHIRRLY